MFSLIKYIIEKCNEYKSFYNFYIIEFNQSISILDFFIFLFLIFVFFVLIIRFLIQLYTLKVFLIFLLKRFIFGGIVLIVINLNFFFFSCDEISQSNNIFNNNITKYTCVAVAVITGCYLSYNYLPVWYTSVQNYTKYTRYLVYKKKEDKYHLDFDIYLKNLSEKKLSIQNIKKNKLESEAYTKTSEHFNLFIDNFLTNYRLISTQVSTFSTSIDIIKINNFFNDYKIMKNISPDYLNLYQGKFYCLFKNYNKIENSINNFKKSSIVKQGFNQDEVLITQIKLFENLVELFNFYGSVVIPFTTKVTFPNGEFKDPHLIKDLSLDIQITHIASTIDKLLDKTLESSINMLKLVEAIEILPEAIKPEIIETVIVNPSGFTSIVKPKKPKMPEEFKEFNFSLDNLEGVKFISINLGYICFYPVLYCSNKMLGTSNPLSEKLFKEAVYFFVAGWF